MRIEPIEVAVPDAVLADLRERLLAVPTGALSFPKDIVPLLRSREFFRPLREAEL